jgi:acetyl-CoA C-acetyltransferase
VEVLGKLRTVFKDGVQTGGNSSALTDAAAAALVGDAGGAAGLRARAAGAHGRRGGGGRAAADHGHRAGAGHPAAARARSGLALGDIARFEINEAQGAQTLAVARELGAGPRRA